jgi:hypothetical protein
MKRRKGSDGGSDGEKAQKERLTPRNAKRAIAVSKVVAPALMPVAVRAAGLARGMWDERKARRLGVPATELNNFTGKGGALHARIARVGVALAELQAATGNAGGPRTGEVNAFVAEAGPRLLDLAAAVRAAELMPAERRRGAHRAVAAELDHIEPRLLELLGIPATDPVSDMPPAGATRPR